MARIEQEPAEVALIARMLAYHQSKVERVVQERAEVEAWLQQR